jgi:hypothetical protein
LGWFLLGNKIFFAKLPAFSSKMLLLGWSRFVAGFLLRLKIHPATGNFLQKRGSAALPEDRQAIR